MRAKGAPSSSSVSDDESTGRSSSRVLGHKSSSQLGQKCTKILIRVRAYLPTVRLFTYVYLVIASMATEAGRKRFAAFGMSAAWLSKLHHRRPIQLRQMTHSVS